MAVNRNTTVRVYIDTIRKTPLLKPGGEKELAEKAKAGDEEARHKMIESNLRLVVKIAKEYQGRGLPLMHLIEDGNMALMRAVEGYDPSKGNRFSTYAYECIRREIQKSVMEKGPPMRIPSHLIESVVKWKRIASSMAQDKCGSASWEDASKKMKFPSHRLDSLKTALNAPLSTSRQVGPDTTSVTLADMISDTRLHDPDAMTSGPEGEKRIGQLLAALKTLSEQEAEILRLHYGIDTEKAMTLKDIAAEYGVSRQRICQIKKSALEKLHEVVLEEDFDLE